MWGKAFVDICGLHPRRCHPAEDEQWGMVDEETGRPAYFNQPSMPEHMRALLEVSHSFRK